MPTTPPTTPPEAPGNGSEPEAPKKKRKYTVLQELDDGQIARVGDYDGEKPDDACWAAIDKKPDFKAASEAAGKGDKDAKPPKLAAVLADRLVFEEHVLEPVLDTRRVKR